MKKITLLIFAALFSLAATSQITLELNNGDTTMTLLNSVGCLIGDTYGGRNFVLADFSVPDDFQLTSGEIGVQEIGADNIVTVNVYTSNAVFDESSFVLLGTQLVTLPSNSGLSIVSYTFDAPINVPNGTEALFVEIVSAAADYFIGGTSDNTAGAESYLKSIACATPSYVTATSIGYPDAHYYITVTGNSILGVNNTLANHSSIFPNPASDILNVKLPSNVEVLSAELVDVLGKNTGISFNNGEMNVAALAQGLYILNLKTTAGTLTQKIVKN